MSDCAVSFRLTLRWFAQSNLLINFSRRNYMILVTGGAGFIGANFVLDWLHGFEEAVLNVDALTYAGNLGTLKSQQGNARHVFARANICDRAAMDALLAEHRPRAILHFA